MNFKNIKEYFVHVRHVVACSKCSDQWHSIRLNCDNRYEGRIFADQLLFKDGSFLRFSEKVVVEKSEVKHLKYSYHFEKNPMDHIFFVTIVIPITYGPVCMMNVIYM